MSYPVLANWIEFKKISDEEYLVRDKLINSEFELDAYAVHFAQQLDGKTDPYKVDRNLSRKSVRSLVEMLEYNRIIRHKRILEIDFPSILITLGQPENTEGLRIFSFIANQVLMISFLPLFVFSIWYFITYLDDISMDYLGVGSVAGIVAGMILHEMGHMFACLGYGGTVFEFGAMFWLIFPGAYVLTDDHNIKTRMRKVQMFAAGVEMNLLLTALLLILSIKIPVAGGFFIGAAVQNIFLALVNMTFVNGFDGMAIISCLLGVENLAELSRLYLKNIIKKETPVGKGIAGRTTVAVCCAVRAVQIALPLFLAVNITGVISWFV